MKYEALSEGSRGAALTELIPSELRARGVVVNYAEAVPAWAFSYVVWVGGGGFFEWGWGSSYVKALEDACNKVVSRIGGTRDGNP